MMRHATLRSFMRNKHVRQDYVLKDCRLVIEGDSFFRGSYSYKESGCHFILGGEFDRYADHLKKSLAGFIESNVTCYFIFNGGMKADIDKRKEIHQKLIDEKICIVPGDEKYYEPIFVKDVQRQVLEELGIRYYVCENDARETLFDVSEAFHCPMLTNNIEYCLLGKSCITPNTIEFDKISKQIKCKILSPGAFRSFMPVNDNMKPIFLTILDENGLLFNKIPEIIGSTPRVNPVGPLMYWIKRQRPEEAITDLAKNLATEDERKTFRESVDALKKLLFDKRKSPALAYFKSDPNSTLSSGDKNWFRNGVMCGRIAIPYVNLINNSTFSGSWVICEKDRDDAMLPAMDIVMYAYSVLTNSQKSVITFIGRNGDKSCHAEISSHFFSDVSFDSLFEKNPRRSNDKKQSEVSLDLFRNFVDKALPGFDWSLLPDVTENCWVLIITLVYYISKANCDFLPSAHSILLSFMMLGPVSDKVGMIKRSNLTMSHSLPANKGEGDNACNYEDCLSASHAMLEYFYEGSIKKTFDRGVLHDLAEFQHCLQQMNYLNKLCGEKIKCTNYAKTYNGTFVFNALLRIREQKNPMVFIEAHLKSSPSVLRMYQRVREVFENCLSAVQKKTGLLEG